MRAALSILLNLTASASGAMGKLEIPFISQIMIHGSFLHDSTFATFKSEGVFVSILVILALVLLGIKSEQHFVASPTSTLRPALHFNRKL